MKRAKPSGIALNSIDAAIVKGMLNRGDRQHDIAAWFGFNGGRIAEIASGKSFRSVVATNKQLPPPGPYLSGRDSHKLKSKLLEAIKSLETTQKQLAFMADHL
ncbi:MAG: hypothetical protein AAGJ50_02350 [Pseudomonadota bacterium]